jgi:hypothetical protein
MKLNYGNRSRNESNRTEECFEMLSLSEHEKSIHK